MGVQVNKIDRTTVSEFDGALYTGRAILKVIAINPSQSELQGAPWNYKQEKPPVYVHTKDGATKQIINIQVEAVVPEGVAEDGKPTTKVTSVSFFLGPDRMESTYIDNFGKFGNDKSKLDQASARLAWKGEIDLVRFIENWCGVKKGETCNLDSIEAIATTGDITELHDIFAAAKDNELYGLLYVRDGKYQDLYKSGFERAFSKNSEFTHKSLAREWKDLKGDFGPITPGVFKQSDFALRLYEPKGGAATTATSKPAANTAANTANPAANAAPQANPLTQTAKQVAPAATAAATAPADPNEPPF